MRYLIILILTGCQITVARLPAPVDAEVAKVLGNHEQALKVLVDEYNKKNKENHETK